MELVPSQQEAANEIVELYRRGENRVRLIGSAGTGKTFLVAYLVKLFKKDYSIFPEYGNGTIYVTAPTNKALAVLQDKIYESVEFKTIHSALKIRRFIDSKTGIETFNQAPTINKFRNGTEFDRCKWAGIDESSMLESKIEGNTLPENHPDYIAGFLKQYKFPILYIGDDKQLAPIGEKVSPVFAKDYPTVRLTKIIRQGEGNPIIDLSNDLDMVYFKQPNIINGKGYTYSNNRNNLIDSLCEARGTDEFKYLAYTNKAIDSMNEAVRNRLFNNKPRRIEKGETIVFNKPHAGHYTNKEVEVKDVVVVVDNVDVPTEKTKFSYNLEEWSGPMDRIKMKYYRINDSFNVLHEDSDAIFRIIGNTIKENCANYAWDYKGKAYFLEQFADITYNHAITIHKSQGSTYKNTIINIRDISFCPDMEDTQRLLYTAVTRASDLVILNEVK